MTVHRRWDIARHAVRTAGSPVGAGLMDSFVVTEFGIDQPRPFRESLRSLPAGRLVVLAPVVLCEIALAFTLLQESEVDDVHAEPVPL